MIEDILHNKIEKINEALAWIKDNRPDDYNQKFQQLVECRRALKTIANAAENNPGIAAFGKSQVGKSYLISCLLQDNGKPFMVKSGSKAYDFVFEINPPSEEGGGRESTGVVSRFSSFKRHPDLYNRDLPVLIRTFTVADVVTILSDSYFNDFANYTSHGDDEIKQLSKDFINKYSTKATIAGSPLSADDMLFIKDYFKKHINHASAINKSAFFDRLSMIIDRVPVNEYATIFSNLWHNNDYFTMLFNKLLDTLRTFSFAKYIYLPIESVLHNGVRENTIMSVQCLKQLFLSDSPFKTDAYTFENGQFIKRASDMPKSELCAICAEAVFKIEDEFLKSTGHYDLEGIGEDVKARINQKGVNMDMLTDNDLLDFPGARSREQEKVEKLSKGNVLDFYLRGKVAYLFNKYNENMGINILLYCHHNKDNDVTNLYSLLEEWVNNYVGHDPEERRQKLEQTKISPLFYIGTMFNLDMTLGVGAQPTESAIAQRWKGRFETVMNGQCFHRHSVEWIKNWTAPGEDFKNSYVLRDYKFSGPKSGLYDGFEQTKRETSMIMKKDYYDLMRKTFINDTYVKQFFDDPALSWDVAATINNDGALFIIEKLAEVASRMEAARESDFERIMGKVSEKAYDFIKDYHISTNIDDILETNIRKAKAIFREMDFTCNSDNYYFGHLIQALQFTETESYRAIHKIMQSTEINSKVNDFKDYEIIRNSCKNAGYPILDNLKIPEKWHCVMATYGMTTREEAEEYLKRKGVDAEKLFSGTYKRKLNSCIIGDTVFQCWCDSIRSVDFLNEFTDEKGFDGAVMNYLIDDLINTAEQLHINDLMAESIAGYVNVVNIHTASEYLLADILASRINDFVLDFGFKYMSDADKQNAKEKCEKFKLPAFNYIEKVLPPIFEEAELTQLFNEMSTNPKALLPSFDDNYNRWIEYMFISFVAHLDIPKGYDHDANVAIAAIMESIKKAG